MTIFAQHQRHKMIRLTLYFTIFSTFLILTPTGSHAGILDYNLMNCMEFSRHIVNTVPGKIGLFRRDEDSLSKISSDKRRFVSGLVDYFRHLLATVTNVGDQNVINCLSQEPLSMCMTIDSFLEQIFPKWFFEYQVTHNFNHVISQVTESPYHALFEAGLKAYACFCAC